MIACHERHVDAIAPQPPVDLHADTPLRRQIVKGYQKVTPRSTDHSRAIRKKPADSGSLAHRIAIDGDSPSQNADVGGRGRPGESPRWLGDTARVDSATTASTATLAINVVNTSLLTDILTS